MIRLPCWISNNQRGRTCEHKSMKGMTSYAFVHKKTMYLST